MLSPGDREIGYGQRSSREGEPQMAVPSRRIPPSTVPPYADPNGVRIERSAKGPSAKRAARAATLILLKFRLRIETHREIFLRSEPTFWGLPYVWTGSIVPA